MSAKWSNWARGALLRTDSGVIVWAVCRRDGGLPWGCGAVCRRDGGLPWGCGDVRRQTGGVRFGAVCSRAVWGVGRVQTGKAHK